LGDPGLVALVPVPGSLAINTTSGNGGERAEEEGGKEGEKGRRGKKGKGRGKILIPGFRLPNSRM
jgi:hypothetical protein